MLRSRSTPGLALVLALATPALSQTPAPEPSSPDMDMQMEMMTDGLGLGMSREGSGTAWQADATPVYGHHFAAGDWMLMLHYNVLAGYDDQGSSRGDRQFMSVNWAMLMAQHTLLGGQLTARVMLSGEALTTGGKTGYPLVLQTGEQVGGVALHDRQHPHDLFMEVAARYSHPLTSDLAFELYAAPSGEPALGPVAFPHRLSASSNPFAVLGHHWMDSTHVSFGVVSAGLYTKAWKLEGSYFNGHEPDENRYNFDFKAFDSYSARLSFNPSDNWSLQASYGYLASPEVQEPGNSQRRFTASVNYDRPLGEGNWASTAVFGHNTYSQSPATLAALVETNFELHQHTVFGRAELVQRTGADLVLAPSAGSTVFNAGVLELGYVKDWRVGPMTVGLGVVGSADLLSAGLKPYYGTSVPLSGMLFVRLRPGEDVAHMAM